MTCERAGVQLGEKEWVVGGKVVYRRNTHFIVEEVSVTVGVGTEAILHRNRPVPLELLH